jgi:hypothetical protein
MKILGVLLFFFFWVDGFSLPNQQEGKRTPIIEYVIYDYQSDRLPTLEDFEGHIYVKIYKDGFTEVNDHRGDKRIYYSIQLSTELLEKLKGLTTEKYGLLKHRRYDDSGRFFAGTFSYLSIHLNKKETDRICFISEDTSELFEETIHKLERECQDLEKEKLKNSFQLSETLIEEIKTEHNQSPLPPIISPPPLRTK